MNWLLRLFFPRQIREEEEGWARLTDGTKVKIADEVAAAVGMVGFDPEDAKWQELSWLEQYEVSETERKDS